MTLRTRQTRSEHYIWPSSRSLPVLCLSKACIDWKAQAALTASLWVGEKRYTTRLICLDEQTAVNTPMGADEISAMLLRWYLLATVSHPTYIFRCSVHHIVPINQNWHWINTTRQNELTTPQLNGDLCVYGPCYLVIISDLFALFVLFAFLFLLNEPRPPNKDNWFCLWCNQIKMKFKEQYCACDYMHCASYYGNRKKMLNIYFTSQAFKNMQLKNKLQSTYQTGFKLFWLRYI